MGKERTNKGGESPKHSIRTDFDTAMRKLITTPPPKRDEPREKDKGK